MKLKDLVFPIALGLLATYLIQNWFFGGKGTKVQDSPVGFVAPKSKQEIKLLNREIDFIDEKRLQERVLTEVETDLATYVFSSDGASLDRLSYKGKTNGKLAGLGTVFPVSDMQRDDTCLLLAFSEKTPYYYKFISKTDKSDSVQVLYRYESPNSDYSVDKTFIVYKKTYKMDLMFAVTPKKKVEEGLETRVFYPSPFMPELGKNDVISAVIINKLGKFQKTNIKSSEKILGTGSYLPKLFGSDSKYFVHAMIEDPQGYAQRAYYKITDGTKLFSILEGPTVNEKQVYTVSFYFGPKEEDAMAMVDPRLEKTLEYSGWFSVISKILLKILKFLNKYLKNYGLAIIVLTLMIRLLMLPFSIKAEKGMKQRMEFQKKLEYLKKKHKNDKAAFAREQAELIKRHGMPGLGGCLPLLIQIPIFIALSNLLRSSIEMYRAPFAFWITDLSAKDPYYVLPALMSLAMLAQAFTVDPKQRFMMIAMALVIGPLFATFPAGLSLYIVASVGLGVLQTFLIKKFKSA
ncbi:membrane protein insertase YidC [Candidatus Dependentiae bacterium]